MGGSIVVGVLSPEHDHVLKTFRLLIADLCEQFRGGHPGGAIGMAAIGVALWKYVMRYAPHSPDWFNRDRFVLSNGHTCLFQYTFLHLSGYRAMTLSQLQSYHSARTDSLCPGHPEMEHEGIEVTTGPLGQGVANAVGLAMAATNLAATYNRPGFDVVDNHTWCMVGDACLQEGIALEAISLAGHLRLSNLTIVYDNNQITCDGSVDLTNSEDVKAKMGACGWDVLDVEDGCFDVEGLVAALSSAREAKAGKPTFINVRTVIGVGSAVAGTATAHGVALGKDDVAAMKRAYGFDPAQHFAISDAVRAFFAECPPRGERWVRDWQGLLDRYSAAHPELAAEFRLRRLGQLPPGWEDLLPTAVPAKPTPTRASSGAVLAPLAAQIPAFMVGTADLSPSVHMAYPAKVDFQPPSLVPTSGPPGVYTGRYIHYGVREHAMCAIANGLAAFSPGTFIPVTSSFFIFYLYAAPAVRMGALMRLRVVHAATHDSIGMGEDGPTHQPVELAALYRAMPNVALFRVADAEEAAGAWACALSDKMNETPSIVSTSRHAVPQLAGTRRDAIPRGAYVVKEVAAGAQADVTLLGVGAELHIALAAAAALEQDHGLRARVVSFPCARLFAQQAPQYRRAVLQRHQGVPAVAVEPYVSAGWERWADAAVCMKGFGKSLPGPDAYRWFGFDVGAVVERVRGFVGLWRGEGGDGGRGASEGVEEREWVRGEFLEI
ncbi:uncharacterized protein K452DRAFT_350333 [Aplosporella prunicola CBS 121167]|uniref:Transketolase-like pyrimidine-binding domain-containing protein n=1 Tax=Aplosporella prunicola CBS 121167 TaxID=1176127 RepID=A0A6A6BGH0_9PEZI|nr:uncharacterized protein K452DRAFT_350333 [Aplosporella prunicola CBS 121167]KAF2143239.1 hypothetical protein K452DRAFT_350333 [Aplosporella prunicola CBS 121167]